MSKRQAFRITDLSGGLNPDSNPVLIADNEAAEVKNIRFDRLGSLVSRRGYSRFLDENAGSNILAIGRWSPKASTSGNVVLAALASGHLVRVATGYPSEISGLSTTARGRFLAVDDSVIYHNGVDTPVTYDGTDAVELGMTAPGAAPSTSLGAGALTGSFIYAITFYDSDRLAESSPSPLTATVSPSSQNVTLTLPTTHPRADFVRIYRTDSGGTSLFWMADVALATGSYVDNGTASPVPILPLIQDRSTPLAYEHMAYVKGFVFGSVGNTLYWSRALEPDAWPALNFTEVPFEGNDTIRALAAFQDTLVIFGRKNIVLVAGAGGLGPTAWSLSRLDVDSGAVSGQAVVEIDGSLAYLDYDGLKALPGAQRLAPKLDRVFAALTPTQIEQARLLYVPEERAIWISLEDGTYTVHLPNRAISWYDFRSDGWVSGGADGFGYPLFIDAASSRFVNAYGAVNDLGADISILWRSKIFQLTNPELVKYFRRIGAFASIGSAGIVTVTISDSGRTFAVPLGATTDVEGASWDIDLWDAGSAVYAAEGLQYFIAALPAQTLFGHTMQVTVTAEVPDRTEVVSPITFEFREANRFLGQ